MTGRLPFVLAILVAADITGLAGQTGSVPTGAISGVVVDASSGQPWFPDARIELVRLGSISGMVVGEAAARGWSLRSRAEPDFDRRAAAVDHG